MLCLGETGEVTSEELSKKLLKILQRQKNKNAEIKRKKEQQKKWFNLFRRVSH